MCTSRFDELVRTDRNFGLAATTSSKASEASRRICVPARLDGTILGHLPAALASGLSWRPLCPRLYVSLSPGLVYCQLTYSLASQRDSTSIPSSNASSRWPAGEMAPQKLASAPFVNGVTAGNSIARPQSRRRTQNSCVRAYLKSSWCCLRFQSRF